MPAAAAVFVLTGIVAGLLVREGSGLAVVAFTIYFVAVTLFTGIVVRLVADVQDGRRDATARQLLRASTPVLGQLILVGVAAALGIAAGFVLFVIPGLILLTLWSVAAPVVVIENPGVFPALRRSRLLVAGNGLQVFAVIVILVVLVAVVGNVIVALAASAGTGAGIVAWVIVGCSAHRCRRSAAAVMYFELRARAAAPRHRSPGLTSEPPHEHHLRHRAAAPRGARRRSRSCSPTKARARPCGRRCRRWRRGAVGGPVGVSPAGARTRSRSPSGCDRTARPTCSSWTAPACSPPAARPVPGGTALSRTLQVTWEVTRVVAGRPDRAAASRAGSCSSRPPGGGSAPAPDALTGSRASRAGAREPRPDDLDRVGPLPDHGGRDRPRGHDGAGRGGRAGRLPGLARPGPTSRGACST